MIVKYFEISTFLMMNLMADLALLQFMDILPVYIWLDVYNRLRLRSIDFLVMKILVHLVSIPSDHFNQPAHIVIVMEFVIIQKIITHLLFALPLV